MGRLKDLFDDLKTAFARRKKSEAHLEGEKSPRHNKSRWSKAYRDLKGTKGQTSKIGRRFRRRYLGTFYVRSKNWKMNPLGWRTFDAKQTKSKKAS